MASTNSPAPAQKNSSAREAPRRREAVPSALIVVDLSYRYSTLTDLHPVCPPRPMSPNENVIAGLARQHGLARVPLFRPGENSADDQHEVLLDGVRGSFVVSASRRAAEWDPASWAWSAHVPHHVFISGNNVSVVRWDAPAKRFNITLDRINDKPAEFYSFLRKDHVEDKRNLVAQAMDLFRRLRSLVQHAGIPDARSIDVYLNVLSSLVEGFYVFPPAPARTNAFVLPSDAAEITAALPEEAVELAIREFKSIRVPDQTVKAWPALAIRHASASIFQEAHNALPRVPGPDMFAYVNPTSATRIRGTVHFTPPSIARAVAEQALRSLDNLHGRRRVVIADFACGSGAFLIECLRALERSAFKGPIRVIGRDVSSVAVNMARFAVGLALSEWPGTHRSEFDIGVEDALSGAPLPAADVIVMNPPFVAWQDLDSYGRDLLVKIIGERQGRPDLSMAFVVRALDSLEPGGVIASLLPASVLEADSTTRWRKQLTDRGAVTFVAVFDDHGLFSQATVRLGAFVLTTGASPEDTIRLRAGAQPEAVSDALRALRRISHAFENSPATGPGWSITRAQGSRGQTILSGRPKKEAVAAGLSTVGELFRVMQGIRTGCNPAFVRTELEFSRLPAQERVFFRRAITSRGIFEGRVRDYAYVFYPYRDGRESIISTENELRKFLPVYFEQYLFPYELKLKQRPRIGGRWWELSEKRPHLAQGGTVFVCKYFAEAGGIAVDKEGLSLVLQGFGWVPLGSMAKQLKRVDNNITPDATAAYLALLNSHAFFGIVGEYSPPVAGGQKDMSPRYINSVPLPDLTLPMHKAARATLAEYARDRYLQEPSRARHIEPNLVEEIVRSIFDVSFGKPARPARAAPMELPSWVRPLTEGRMEGPSDESRVEILMTMQGLARGDDVSEIDTVLEHVDVTGLAEISLITLLRGTFAFHSRLRSWHGFRDRVGAEFLRRGINVDKVLAGL